MWPIIHDAEKTMETLVSSHINGNNGPAKNNNAHNGHEHNSHLAKRALDQAARELLLLESSDWPFLVTTGQAKDYAIERFNTHHERFKTLADMLKSGQYEEAKIAEIENTDNCFPDINPEHFSLSLQTGGV